MSEGNTMPHFFWSLVCTPWLPSILGSPSWSNGSSAGVLWRELGSLHFFPPRVSLPQYITLLLCRVAGVTQQGLCSYWVMQVMRRTLIRAVLGSEGGWERYYKVSVFNFNYSVEGGVDKLG